MDSKTDALTACDNNWKDNVARAVKAYSEAFSQAEGTPEAAATRKSAGDRFKTALRMAQSVRDNSRALVEQTFS
jgi:hypothetical protein